MYQNVLSRVYNQPHVIRPDKLEAIRRAVTARALGVSVDASAIEHARAAAADIRKPQIARSVAVLPILGTLAKRMDMLSESSGGTSTDRLGKELDSLLADDTVGAIVLDVDSPGGESFGVPELARKIFEARDRKPILAVVNAEMASGALWIGSAAGEVSITPSGWIGSLGVYMAHTDLSVANEAIGMRTTYISAGEYKVEWTSDAPLSDETRAYYQQQVDQIYGQFVSDVAKFRGTTPAEVRANYGKGRMFQAAEAKRVGMVDRIETLEEAISRLAGTAPKRGRSSRTEIERRRLELERYR